MDLHMIQLRCLTINAIINWADEISLGHSAHTRVLFQMEAYDLLVVGTLRLQI